MPVAASNIAYSNTVSLATLGAEADMNQSYYIGTIEDFKVRVVPGIPQYYGVGFKSCRAELDAQPAAGARVEGANRPQVVAMADPRSGNGAWPLQYLMLFTEYGVGVGDRTAATPRYFNNATWADGTPA